jgi:DNA-binding beta-propeller fold protein YncE
MAPAGDYIYWGNGADPSVVHKLRTSDLVEVGSLTLPSPPAASAGALSPDGSIGYVVNSAGANGTITKIRLSDMTTLAQVPFGVTEGNAMVITPDGSYLYIAAADGTISDATVSALGAYIDVSVSGSAVVIKVDDTGLSNFAAPGYQIQLQGN